MPPGSFRNMLQLNNVEVMYQGTILVLKGVSMEVPQGAIVTLIGANGAGKTTTLKGISGLLSAEEGEVSDGSIVFDGQRIDHAEPSDIVRMGILQVMEGRRVLEHLTVEQNLKVGGHLRHDPQGIKADLERVYDYFPPLKRLRNKISGWLSGGEQQMLVIGRALMAKPKVTLLDEPSLGLSPILVREIFHILHRLNSEEKISMLLVEQNARIALQLAQYGYVLENGRVVLDGPSPKLRENEDIKEFYLGLSRAGERKSYKAIKHYKRRKRWLG
jgi:branched-chain amino acid transport system ATP-binding protein